MGLLAWGQPRTDELRTHDQSVNYCTDRQIDRHTKPPTHTHTQIHIDPHPCNAPAFCFLSLKRLSWIPLAVHPNIYKSRERLMSWQEYGTLHLFFCHPLPVLLSVNATHWHPAAPLYWSHVKVIKKHKEHTAFQAHINCRKSFSWIHSFFYFLPFALLISTLITPSAGGKLSFAMLPLSDLMFILLLIVSRVYSFFSTKWKEKRGVMSGVVSGYSFPLSQTEWQELRNHYWWQYWFVWLEHL